VLAVGGLIAFATFSGSDKGLQEVVVWSDIRNDQLQQWFNLADKEKFTVTYRYIPSDRFVRTIIDELSLGVSPDVIVTDVNRQFELGQRLQLLPFNSLSPSDFNERYVSGAQDAFYSESGYVGLPMFVDPLILYSNRTLLDTNGIPSAPKYWDEVSQIANQYSKKDGPVVSQIVLPIGTYKNTTNAKDVLAAMFLQTDSSIIEDQESILRPDLNGSTAGSVASYYTDFANLNSGVYNWNESFDTSLAEFAAGNTFFYLGYASEYSQIQSLNPNLDFFASEFPQVRDGIRTTNAKFYGALFPRANQNLEATFDLLTELTDRSLLSVVASRGGLTSALRSEVYTSGEDVLTAIGAKSTLYAKSWKDVDQISTANAFSKLIEDILYRGLTPSDAISDLERFIYDLL
jgi:ABC-type glycerol-3-phosphate transport system substrate-binding protein